MSQARTKRLNESDKPVLNFDIADAQHQLVIPQNTTTNLAEIPNKTASLAYDTTQNAVVVNTGSGFTLVGAGGGQTVHSFIANATVGGLGETQETVGVPGLLATDTVIAVSQMTPGNNVNAVCIGWTAVANNAITIYLNGNTVGGLVVIVTVLR